MSRRYWTDKEVDRLRELYPDTPMPELMRVFGRPERAIYAKANSLGLKKSAAYLASPHASRFRRGDHPGKATQFRKGQTPWNAGLKGYQPGGRSAETQFKPGRRPEESRNYRPIGSLRLSKDGYLERKVTDDQSVYPARRWVGVHRLVWEAAHGPVPKGHIVVFRPGQHTTDPDAITLDRIECISRAENMRRNTYHRYPKEIAQLIQLRGAISRQINKRTKA